MKLYKRLILLAAVVIISVVGYFVARDIIAKNSPRPIYELNPVIANYISTDVTEVTIYNDGMVMNLKQKEEVTENEAGQRVVKKVWYLEGEEDVRLNQDRIQGLVISATNLTGKNIIEEKASDLNQYGLTGDYYVRIKTVHGVEYTITLGDLLYNRDGFYAMRDDNRTVYSISVYPAQRMYITRAELLDLRIFTGTVLDVERVTLVRNNELIYSIAADKNFIWLMKEPVDAKGNINLVDELVKKSTELFIKKYVDLSPEDLAEYSLDKPRYEITLKIRGKDTTLLIGREDIREGVFYAMIKGIDEVFTVDSKTLTFLDDPTVNLLVEFQYTPDFKLLRSIETEVNGMNLLFEIGFNEEVGMNDYKFNGKSINRIDAQLITFGVFYYGASTLVPVTEIDADWEVAGDPLITMKYTYTDGNSETIEFYEKDDNNCYFVRNGRYTGLTVSKNYLVEGYIPLVELIYTGELMREWGIEN